MRFTTTTAVLVFSLASLSCSPPTPPEPEGDAGVDESQDAGLPVDAGSGADAGGFDAGAVDAGGVDAGGEPDSGTDGGAPDAGLDAGVDAGPPDAGCVCNLPRFCDAAMRCVADLTPPTITVTGSAGQTNATIRVQGSAIDLETGVTSVSVRVNQQPPQSVPVVAGAFDAQLPVPASGRAEFTIAVTGADLAGNSASASAVFDPTAPEIVATPADYSCAASGCTGAFINAATAVFTLSATVTDLALATSHPVRVRVVTTSGTELVPPTDLVLQGSSWTWIWTSFPRLDDTLIDFELTATDVSGNVGTAVIHGAIDRSVPDVMISSPDAMCGPSSCTGTVFNTTSASAVLSGSASAGTDLRIRVVDGAAVVVGSTNVAVSPLGDWSWTWVNLPNVDGRFYRFEATATDRLGNATLASAVVLVDRAPPGVAINSPAPAQLVGSATVGVNATATDGLGVGAVTMSSGASVVTATRTMSGDFVGSLSVPVVDAVSQTISVQAVDLAGNSRTVTRSYVADRVAPVVTVNGADFDCSAPGQACTGMVANGSSTNVPFSGTATDGSALTLSKILFGTSQVASSTDPVSGGAWAWTWSSLPANVNGAAYELRLVATDAAGNVSPQVVRRLWLDNVAPTVTVPVANQRNVSRTATLLSFSEPMVTNSVLAGVSFLPAAMLTGFGTTDGRNFGFASPILRNYVWYHLVDTTSRDRAGNDLVAIADAYFLSEPVVRSPLTVVRPALPGYTYRFPVLAVDSDQQLFVNYTATNATATTTEAEVLDAAGTSSSLANAWTGWSLVRGGEMRIVAESRGADQRLAPTIEHTYVSGTGVVGFGTQTTAWGPYDLRASFSSTANIATITPTLATIDQLRPTIDLRPYASGVRRGIVAPNVGATAMNSNEYNAGAWTTTAPAALSSFRKMDGRASVEATATLGQYRVRYFDLSSFSEVGTFGFVRAATGQPALKRLDPFFGVPTATSGSFMAWASDTQLTIACSPSPFSASPVWRPTALSMPATTTGTGLTSAMNSSKVVFAAEFGGNVYVHSTPVNGCGASPAVTQLAILNGMKEPNVFIDASGAVWVAAISTAGEVVVHKL